MPDPPEIIALPSGPTPVRFRHSPRARRVSLRIDSQGGHVVVTLPARAARSAGLALLRTHADWVSERLARLPQPVQLCDGAVVPLAGEACRIRHVPQGRGGAWLDGNEIHVSGEAAFLPRRALDLLRREARTRLGALVAAHAATLGVAARRVVVKDTRSRWGSCSPDGVVMLCWRLVMAPPLVQDYVAAHEVAHLRHMNHGPEFWRLVGHLAPRAPEAMRWLHANGASLQRVG